MFLTTISTIINFYIFITIISAIIILTDNTPDSAYDMLVSKQKITEDWIYE